MMMVWEVFILFVMVRLVLVLLIMISLVFVVMSSVVILVFIGVSVVSVLMWFLWGCCGGIGSCWLVLLRVMVRICLLLCCLV